MFSQIARSFAFVISLLALFISAEDSAEDSSNDLSSLCVLTYDDFIGYSECGRFAFNGGCSEHFAGALWQDKTGTISFAECCAKCTEMNCKSFSYGKQGVARENWCNVYIDVECTASGDTDWHTFLPGSIDASTPSNYAVAWLFNGGCAEHFTADILYKDETGLLSFDDCASQCREKAACGSFTYGKAGVSRANWCTLYDVVCSDNGDTDWNMYVPSRNAELACETYDCN